MWRHFASNALSLLAVGLFLVGGVLLWSLSRFESEGPLTEAICLQVVPNSTMGTVARNLEAQEAVTSRAIFRLAADYTDRAADLKAGSFLIPPGASMADILDIVTIGGRSTCGTEVIYRVGVNRLTVQVRELEPSSNSFETRASFNPAEQTAPSEYEEAKGDPDTRFRIAIAEGATSWQIATALNEIDILSGSTSEIPPEGTLAPNSYELSVGSERESLLEQMIGLQASTLESEWASRAEGLPYASPAEALIMASIIEKETSVPEERGQVASVFVNRLERGMRLQTDPTVIYGITRGEGVLGRGLRQSELRRETPWNTYVIDGLPPTPIANPGAASIRAALNPDDTPFIFFVADGTGGHAFAETLAEHNENVARWRAIEAERANSE